MGICNFAIFSKRVPCDFCWYVAIFFLNLKMRLGPVWTNSMVSGAHSLLSICPLPSVLSTWLEKSEDFFGGDYIYNLVSSDLDHVKHGIHVHV